MTEKLRDRRKRPVFIHSCLDDLPLSLESFRVYCHLARRVSDNNEAWPSYASIAETCFRGSYPNSPSSSLKRKAMDAVKELEAWGLIAVERKQQRLDGGQTSNIYSLTDESEWHTSVQISTRNVRNAKKVSIDIPPSDTGDTPPSDTGDTPPSDTGDTPPSDTGDTPNRRISILELTPIESYPFPPLTPQREAEGVRESEAIDVNVEVLPPEDILATAPDLNQSLQTPRKLGQENSSTAPPKIENRSQNFRSQFPKDLNGNDIFPWDLPLESPERGKKFNLQFEKHMARSLMGYPAYKNLMAGELMVKVRKHIAGGRHDPKRRDELLIEWDGFQSGETHPTSTMTAKGAARRAKIASALSLNSSEGV